ncbi:unnamed protein product [Darwinula stevensoni]|uniref:tRNA (guanine-N(1)-)-methyltransferase n=1 Tax=Darwinula stevensoni TaxID=69355 RepID=A0A7R9AIJ5_9CRUS|nr:unnamed protein product [Darwinula stevensoni]CAG0905645.1 unnamed protein product [Darwinula stevensoni]
MSCMHIHVITLFPEMFKAILEYGVTGRAWSEKRFELSLWNPRDFTTDPYRRIDDRPYGGGPGMVMMIEPLLRTLQAIFACSATWQRHQPRVVLTSPQGHAITHEWIVDQQQASCVFQRDIVLVCGRYEAIDQRWIDAYVDEQISLGDFVISGGEIAAMAVMDAMIRLLPGVLKGSQSCEQDSFVNGVLDCPHYTRPESSELGDVPEVLLSGHHANIMAWRREQSLQATFRQRPELIDKLIDLSLISPVEEKMLKDRRATKLFQAPRIKQPDESSEDFDVGPSKTQIKKQMNDIQNLGKAMLELSVDQRKTIPIDDQLFESMKEFDRLKSHEARRRQLQYIGKLMRHLDEQEIIAITDSLNRLQGKSAEATAELHRIERMRDRLLNDPQGEVLTNYLADHPHVDKQGLRTLLRNFWHAQHHDQSEAMRKNSREIFQLIKNAEKNSTPDHHSSLDEVSIETLDH